MVEATSLIMYRLLAYYSYIESGQMNFITVDSFWKLLIILQISFFAFSYVKYILISVIVFKSNEKLQKDMTYTLFRAKVSFFDKTSFGKIISRYTNDLNKLDSGMVLVNIDVFERMFTCLGIIINICIMLPYFIITNIILLIVMVYWYLYFKNGILKTK
jgi:ABC-type multidrug transport system fused ATPase/permease subunit